MNLSSRTATGRSRSADGDAFLHPTVVHTTEPDPSGPPAASPHAWKRVFQERIWSQHGPKGLAARSVLTLLVWHADAQGRAWLGVQTIANKIGAGSVRTVRNALDALVRDGWLKSTPQTWATLTAEQTAAGRPAPRRDDVGQAPNLYVVLDGRGNTVTRSFDSTNPMPTRPGLARVPTPGRKCSGDPGPFEPGPPLPDLHVDLDPKGSRSRIERAERTHTAARKTHTLSKIHLKGETWFETWNVIVDAHVDKTNRTYGLPPLPPDLKLDQQKALAECLDGATADVRAKLRDRSGIELDQDEVRLELAKRVMQLYFKRDVEHLRRVKHALRDLPREFHARITEAMQMMLRESHDATKPRQTQVEVQIGETNDPVAPPTIVTPPVVQIDVAREARRVLDALGTTTMREESPNLTEKPHVSGQDKPHGQDKPTQGMVVASCPPHWSVVGPRPVKVRSIRRFEPSYEADDEPAQEASF